MSSRESAAARFVRGDTLHVYRCGIHMGVDGGRAVPCPVCDRPRDELRISLDLAAKCEDVAVQAERAKVERRERELAEARTDRDRWIRLFNRLEAAISHHKRDNQFADAEDEGLWAARDRILSDAGKGDSGASR